MGTRARKASKKALEAEEAEGLFASALAGVPEPHPSRKSKTSSSSARAGAEAQAPAKQRRKRTRVPLHKLIDMPIEIVTHILSFIDFQGLYGLANADMVLRAFLFSPALERLWIDKQEEAHFPELFMSMTPIQKAHLVWGSECFFCHEPGKRTKAYFHLKRMCVPSVLTCRGNCSS